jgi:cell division protein ZapE
VTGVPPKKTWFKRAARPAGSQAAGQRIHEHFQAQASRRGYTLDSSQLAVIDSLAMRAEQLDQHRPASSLYLHGAVGRGKSWLLDGFFQAAALENKRRIHFHDFFARLHQGMFRHRALDDPLAHTLDELLNDCRLLCFDEFHVHDIGDAMLITRLFKALFARQILLIVTSNYAPEGLLPNPLYHERFLPVIRLIHAQMQVMEVGGPTDYRSLAPSHESQRFTQGRYLCPGSASQRQAAALPVAGLPHFPLQVGLRQLRVRLEQGRQVVFTFEDLCEQPTAVMDYLQLCERFDHWVIDGLPLLEECSIAVQQRFINLVDVLYDQDKRLDLISEWPLDLALAASAVDLMRTRSRLGQLDQSVTP